MKYLKKYLNEIAVMDLKMSNIKNFVDNFFKKKHAVDDSPNYDQSTNVKPLVHIGSNSPATFNESKIAYTCTKLTYLTN